MTHPGADDAHPARRRRRSIFRDDSDDLGLRDAWAGPTSDAAAPTAATDDLDAAPSIFRAGLPDSPPADSGTPDGIVR
ncbi:hypothetical protein [Actinomycetospora callitridis]|uniref:hypothetical protein n=1 Tax=Actinomycetospora callitridis TaxID=913944 RepID=UPI002367105A|nr:hypothetical protein [Actinomycetospora callitridis]MDD7921117.1 hypothetical protein [Actinomycetospora callitridis]